MGFGTEANEENEGGETLIHTNPDRAEELAGGFEQEGKELTESGGENHGKSRTT